MLMLKPILMLMSHRKQLRREVEVQLGAFVGLSPPSSCHYSMLLLPLLDADKGDAKFHASLLFAFLTWRGDSGDGIVMVILIMLHIGENIGDDIGDDNYWFGWRHLYDEDNPDALKPTTGDSRESTNMEIQTPTLV